MTAALDRSTVTTPDEPVSHDACTRLGKPVDLRSRLRVRATETSPAGRHGKRRSSVRWWLHQLARRLPWRASGRRSPHGDSHWRVEIHRGTHGSLHRRVLVGPWTNNDTEQFDEWGAKDDDWKPELDIWPSWHRTAATVTGERQTLVAADHQCSKDGDRLRESAKWMSTVIGLALTTVIGTSPLAELEGTSEPAWTWIAVGLLLLTGTLVLVLRVLQTPPVSFEDILAAPCGPLRDWRELVESEQDLYLPCGVRCLTTLRETMLVDELTLAALAKAANQDDSLCTTVEEATQDRLYRLNDLRETVGRVVQIAGYYRLRRRSTLATYGGTALAVSAAIAIVAGFLLT